ncbi:MAG TPA: rRNA adenine methyltransferase [Anaerolineae bacterium]|nr:rRNA adenine methyltransferase [Anaerolineae bacterium]
MITIFSNDTPIEESDWEKVWAPYPQDVYQAVLKEIEPSDIVLEIGAGDLRLARQIARVAQKVYAIEMQGGLVLDSVRKWHKNAQTSSALELINNIEIIIGDACSIPFPTDITVGVLLMRYCQHIQHYEEKLMKAGCSRLITNSRWRMGVEVVNLMAPRISYDELVVGWYTCWCGNSGFKAGPLENVTHEVLSDISYEVFDCPRCKVNNIKKD